MRSLDLEDKTEAIVTILGFLGTAALLAWLVYSSVI